MTHKLRSLLTILSPPDDNMLYSRSADPAFHQWRLQTAVFIRSLNATADGEQQQSVAAPYVEAVVRQLEAEVGVLLALGTGGPSGVEDGGVAAGGSSDPPPPSPTSTSSSSSTLRRQLFDVVAEAIGLDADLCQQRAWYYVQYPTSTSGQRYGMPFDATEMETVSASSREGEATAGGGGGGDTHSRQLE